MKSKRVFLMVFLPVLLLILIAGEAKTASLGVSAGFLAQGIVIFGLYGALIGAILGGIAAAINGVIQRRRKTNAPQPIQNPQQNQNSQA
jgi:hypothetical protein